MLMRAVIGMLLAGIALGFGSQPATAQSALVVATCGTLPGSVTWNARQSRQVTVDINGVLCTSAGGTGGAGDASAANQVTGNNTLASILAKMLAAPATEAKQDTGNTALSGILAKIIAAPATEAKQDTGNTSLATIAGKDFATQTTLAAVLAKQPSLGTAGTASTNVLTVQGIASMTPLLVNGSGSTQPVSGTVTVTQGTGTNLHVVCDSGCSSSTAPADESAFTAGTTSMSPIGGFFQTTATNNALTNGQMGALQMTAHRAAFMNLRNSSGTELGNSSSSNPVYMDAITGGALISAINAAVPAGTNVIGKVGIDQTTDGTTNLVAAKQSGTWTVQPGNTANTTPWLTTPSAGTTGGSTAYHLVAAATNNSTSVKGSAGTLYSIQTSNVSASTPAYLKLYNKATAPTCGTDTPVKVVGIPANSLLGGNNVNLGSVGVAFSLGIGICVVTGIADNNNTAVSASTITVALDYK